jgi:hypothetical protein
MTDDERLGDLSDRPSCSAIILLPQEARSTLAIGPVQMYCRTGPLSSAKPARPSRGAPFATFTPLWPGEACAVFIHTDVAADEKIDAKPDNPPPARANGSSRRDRPVRRMHLFACLHQSLEARVLAQGIPGRVEFEQGN